MHFFKINLSVIGALGKGRSLNLYGLLCLAILFKCLVTNEVSGSTLNRLTVDSQQVNVGDRLTSTSIVVLHDTPADLFFDFEDFSERDPDPTGSDEKTGKGNARTGLPLHLLSSAEHRRTQSTLAHCAAALQRRSLIPLFVLYQAWKHFPG